MATTKISSDTTRILRHQVATIAFRASRSLRASPPGFENVRLADGGMTAGELVHHMTNVMAFALSAVTGEERVRHEKLDWPAEIERFYKVLGQVDAKLAAGAVMEEGMDLRLVQGPFADILTHIGQLHALRRLMGSPVVSMSYIKADVQIGRIALEDQAE